MIGSHPGSILPSTTTANACRGSGSFAWKSSRVRRDRRIRSLIPQWRPKEKRSSRRSGPELVIVLDVDGKEFSSHEFAARLQDWQADGRDLTFVIGGPDGVSAACLDRADVRWSLSKLTLPHGLARVLFMEQLYRAWSLTAGHPYHRA